jgi:ATP synthase protein I
MQISGPMLQEYRKLAMQAFYLTIALVIFITLIFALFHKSIVGLAFLLGGALWLAPNYYFLHKVFDGTKSRSTAEIVKDFYLAEAIKLIASVVLLVLVVKIFNITLLPLISGYIVAIAATTFTPLLFGLIKK